MSRGLCGGPRSCDPVEMSHTGDPDARAIRSTGWKTLLVAWLLFLVPVPLASGALGAIFMVFPFMAATVLLVRGYLGAGIGLLGAAVLGSPVVYLVGLAIFARVVRPG